MLAAIRFINSSERLWRYNNTLKYEVPILYHREVTFLPLLYRPFPEISCIEANLHIPPRYPALDRIVGSAITASLSLQSSGRHF